VYATQNAKLLPIAAWSANPRLALKEAHGLVGLPLRVSHDEAQCLLRGAGVRWISVRVMPLLAAGAGRGLIAARRPRAIRAARWGSAVPSSSSTWLARMQILRSSAAHVVA
jgi:hypothetical protein